MNNSEKQTHACPTDEEMKLIGQYTRKEISPQDIYVFSLILCDNEIDRDGERFSIEALEKLATLFPGKTGIFDHSMRGKDQTSRIFEVKTVADTARKTAAGETYTYLEAKAYMVRTEKNADLIAEIDAGIKKEASVGCSVSRVLCSICSADRRHGGCEHIKGKTYGNSVCHDILTNPTDAYEWSFVAVPAQKAAGVIRKSFRPAESDGTELNELADFGREYKAEMTREIIKRAAVALPRLDAEMLGEICKNLNVTQLKALREAIDNGDASTTVKPQLMTEKSAKHEQYNEFKI